MKIKNRKNNNYLLLPLINKIARNFILKIFKIIIKYSQNSKQFIKNRNKHLKVIRKQFKIGSIWITNLKILDSKDK